MENRLGCRFDRLCHSLLTEPTTKGTVMGIIYVNEIEELVQICARLTRQSIAYNAKFNGDSWQIELTGF